jgi:transcriptional regulator with XRE-family HTH domain
MALLKSQALLHCSAKAVLYDIEMTLGKRIKAARERLEPEMTQGKLGAAFGISDKAVSAWERDDTRPDNAKLVKLARILKIPLNWLLDGKGAPPDPDALESVMEQLDPEARALLEAMAQTLLKQRGAA